MQIAQNKGKNANCTKYSRNVEEFTKTLGDIELSDKQGRKMKNNYKDLKETVEPGVFSKWQEVEVEIYAFTDLGLKVAINNEYTGLVYKEEVYDKYQKGQKLKAFVKLVREDGKIDVSLQPLKGQCVFSATDKILEQLKEAGGRLMFNDKSSPGDVKNKFQISKTVFKQAIGKLYKQRKIKITDKGIELVKE